jgi:hypothetical protein
MIQSPKSFLPLPVVSIANTPVFTLTANFNNIRSYSAWLLLLVLCLQRVIGLLEGPVLYSVVLENGMDAVEESIAHRLNEETGLKVHVEIRDESELVLLRSRGYGTPFIFTEEIDGRTVSYTVDQSPGTVLTFSAPESAPEELPSDLPQSSRILKDLIFSKFIFWSNELPVIGSFAARSPGHTIPDPGEDPFQSLRCPPPEAS